MPRRNRNAWRDDHAKAERARAADLTPRPARLNTRRDRRKAQRAFDQGRKAA